MSGYLNLGTGTVYSGTNQVTVTPLGSVTFPASVPTTALGPTPQTTLPPSGNLGYSTSGGMASGGMTSSIGQFTAGLNPGKSQSPVWPTILLFGVSIVGLHWIFWPKGSKEL